ncbi:hypothetical protein KKF55_00640 [Patescibacteria group bacterium]|nr:hypothetical protein [Patescibacteria group bacterium]
MNIRFSLLASLTLLAVIMPRTLYAEEIKSFCKNGEDNAVNAILGVDDGFLTPVPPISDHFTGKVLRRAEKGIEKAFSYTQKFNDDGFMEWAEKSFEAVSITIDTKIHLIQQERSLSQDTTCLHIDLMLIETMMEKVRCKIQYAFDQKQFATVLLLKDIILFLDESYNDLVEGARYNSYAADWTRALPFDDNPYYCHLFSEFCELYTDGLFCTPSSFETMDECTEETGYPAKNHICPFNSDYLPPSSFASGGTVFGYGCDLQTLSQYRSISAPDSKIGEAIQTEFDALQNLIRERDIFIENSQHLKNNAIKLDLWMRRTPSSELQYFGKTVDSEREHYTVSGCSESPLRDSEAEEEYTKRDSDSLWPPIWPTGAIRWTTHGAFSFDRNEMQLMKEYEKLRTEWGKQRPLAYKLPEEFGFLYFLQLYFRTQFKKWDVYQEQQTSTIVAHATDVPRRIIAELTPLRKAIGEFSTYASVLSTTDSGPEIKGGIRGFARGLAYYLRRSCLTRPCNERLERVLKVVLKDECFPYTGGNYQGKIWEDCKRAAKLDEFAD